MANGDFVTNVPAAKIDDALLQLNSRAGERWTVGTKDGIPVSVDDETYQNNAKYYAERAKESSDRIPENIVELVSKNSEDIVKEIQNRVEIQELILLKGISARVEGTGLILERMVIPDD